MSINVILPPPPSLTHNLERSDSKPSLTHTNNTATTDDSPPLLRSTSDLLSPHSSNMAEIRIQREESRSDNEDNRKPFAKLNISKSMQGLRGKYNQKEQPVKPKSGLGRQRAMSVEAKPPPSPAKSKAAPLPLSTANSRPTRPQPTRSSGGFSSFIRKLTGRSTSPPKSKGVEVEPLIAARPAHTQPSDEVTSRPPNVVRPSMVRRPSAPSTSAPKPALRKLDTLTPIPDHIAPASAPAAPQPNSILPGPTPPTPLRPVREIDPCNIPLPPSPGTSPVRASASIPSLSLAPPISTSAQGSVKRVKPSRMLSLEGFEFEEEEEEEEEKLQDVDEVTEERVEREEGEDRDIIKPLEPIRIPNRVVAGGPSGATAAGTPTTPSTLANEIIVTPTSTHSDMSPSKYESMRLAGSSPPRRAPIGTGSGTDLGRKESKWRKSVMGLSETLNRQPAAAKASASGPVSRRTSQRPAPPTSYDSYLAHQKRIAANRVSCAPTIHSTASVAAELREIKDKEEQDMADTFFLS